MSVRPPVTWLLLRWASALLIALVATPAVAQLPDLDRATRFMNELAWGHGQVGGPFELTDQNGKTRTDAEFRGELLLVYFGYTRCPDFCPAELMQIGLAIDKLDGAGDGVQPLFISIDPEHDTPDVLAPYGVSHRARIHRRSRNVGFDCAIGGPSIWTNCESRPQGRSIAAYSRNPLGR
jgi:cytochrome oxidase Cu insertion factor (SCO1/SenC/PrrC family)